MRLFRCIRRYFRDAFKSVIRNFSLSLASISCITITLIVVAISIVLSYNVEHMIKHVSSNTQILVYVDNEATKEEEKNVEIEIKKLSNYDSMEYIPKKDAIKYISSNNGKSLLSYAEKTWTDETNPLMSCYKVKVKDINQIDDTASKIEKIAKVDLVDYGKSFVEMVITIFGAIEKACIGGVIALILVTAFLIANTIKLAIFSRKTEIEIMRLVGASNMAIKIPFIIEGSFIGFLGSIIPIILMSYGYNALYKYLDGQLFSSSLGKLAEPYPFILYSSGLLLLIGLLVGMFGSKRAVKKYLKI